MISNSFNGNVIAGRDVNQARGNIVNNASPQPAPNWETVARELQTLQKSIDSAPKYLQEPLREVTKDAEEAADAKDPEKLKEVMKKAANWIGGYLRDASLAVLQGFVE